MVSTIWSAPPESASSLANIAPSAIRMPTPAAVVPKPAPNDVSTPRPSASGSMFCAGDDAHGQGTEDQREERVQLGDRDQHDDQRDRQPARRGSAASRRRRARELGRREGQRGTGGASVLLRLRVWSTYCWTIASTLWSTSIDRAPRSSGCERLEGGELGGQQRGRHEVARAAGLAPGDDLGLAGEVQERDLGRVVAQLVAVAALERRAAHHATVGVGARATPRSPRATGRGRRRPAPARRSSWRCWRAGGSRRRRRTAPGGAARAAAPTVDLPDPDTPMTTRTSGRWGADADAAHTMAGLSAAGAVLAVT